MKIRPTVAHYTHDIVFRNETDFVHFFVEKDYEVCTHKQEFFEINLITRGEGTHYIENNRHAVSAGDVFIVPPNVNHSYEGGEGFDVFHILLADAFIRKHLTDFAALPSFFILFSAEPLLRQQAKTPLFLKVPPHRFAEVTNLLTTAAAYNRLTDYSHSLMRNGFALSFISLLCDIYTQTEKPAAEERAKDAAFMQAISTIHQRFNEKLTIAELAKIAKLSRSAFLRKFGQVCQMPPAEYITQRRIEQAEYLLRHTQLPIMEIAFQTGFYDAAHLGKTFFSAKGISPSAYRKGV